ncbi:MAG: amidohydrolase family protein [Eubacteriales bacterium]|nr:amidohydrolase family protein [Eubacteriales bacterium]
MSIELCHVPVVDVHAHPFCLTREPKDFAMFASSGYWPGPNQEKYARSKMHYVIMIDSLRKYYGMPEDTLDMEVEAERYRRYHAAPSEYYHAMLKDANIGVLCNEIGTPHSQPMFTDAENAYYDTLVPKENQCEIVRIERVFEVLQEKKLPFRQYIDEFHRLLDEQIKIHHAVGLKSLVAYFTGLSVQDISDEDAEKSYEKYVLQGKEDWKAMKDVYDHVVCMGMEACIRNNLSMQFHVGFGPSSFCRLDDMNPIGLIQIIRSPRFANRVKIVLLHSCDPFIKEAGYLTGQFSNVFCDFSSICFLSVNCASMMRTLMERASIEKLVYGSDCVCFPETAWVSAHYGRKQLTKVLNDLVKEEILSEKRAQKFGEMMLCTNAFAIYPELAERPQFKQII